MNIFIKDRKEAEFPCEALILPFTENERDIYTGLPASLSGVIKRVFVREFRGKKNQTLLIPSPEGLKPERIFFVGLGSKNELSPEAVRLAGGRSGVVLRDASIKRAALSVQCLSSHHLSPIAFTEGILLGTYRFQKYHHERSITAIESVTILSRSSQELRAVLRWTEALSASVNFARDLINTPANDMTPTHLADSALSLKDRNLSVTVLDRGNAARRGMGAYLSVAHGSHQPPKFIVLEYRGSEAKPIVIIGKSITFDSGGLSLKPAEGMEKMKYDMAGGAAVLGVLRALSARQIPVHVIGMLPATENLPGGAASRPGDVVRAINGKTIEIISTDAEGRMTLADAIGFAAQYKPRAIIDIATLTGACAIAFGNCAIAMMGNDRELLNAIKKASEKSGERVWEMPLLDECREYLKSDIADMKNSGGKGGSLLSSAYFLSEFAAKIPWVHLDIAGTAWADKERPYYPKGATGIGVRLIATLLKEWS